MHAGGDDDVVLTLQLSTTGNALAVAFVSEPEIVLVAGSAEADALQTPPQPPRGFVHADWRCRALRDDADGDSWETVPDDEEL